MSEVELDSHTTANDDDKDDVGLEDVDAKQSDGSTDSESDKDIFFEDDDSDSGLDDLNDILKEISSEPVSKNTDNKNKRKQKPKFKKNAKKKNNFNKTDETLKTEDEKFLERLVFGDKKGLFTQLSDTVVKPENKQAVKRKPAWVDSDDEAIKVGEVKRETKHTGSLNHLNKNKSYKEYLTNRFTNIVETPKWADLDREVEVDSDEEILRTVGHIASDSSTTFQPKLLSYKKLRDANRATYSEGKITNVQFHPTSTVAMVTGYEGIVTFYSIDGLRNEKIHNIKFKGFPITCAKLIQSGYRAIFGGNQNYYYNYDLVKSKETKRKLPPDVTNMKKFEISPCEQYIGVLGRFGNVFLLHAKSNELLHTFQKNEPATDLKFSADSSRLICNSVSNTGTIFNLKSQRVEHNFNDDGCISGRAIAISPNSKMFATGSKEGVVNIYNYDDILLSQNPKPKKILCNLTTSISDVKFNHSSEVLGFCSNEIDNALKLAHFPTGTVFANFPGNTVDLGQVGIVEFSPMSGFMALGTIRKKVPLYRLKHFNNY